jgi:hypothetical protein
MLSYVKYRMLAHAEHRIACTVQGKERCPHASPVPAVVSSVVGATGAVLVELRAGCG